MGSTYSVNPLYYVVAYVIRWGAHMPDEHLKEYELYMDNSSWKYITAYCRVSKHKYCGLQSECDCKCHK